MKVFKRRFGSTGYSSLLVIPFQDRSEDLFESAPEDIVESSEDDIDVAATLVPETQTLRDRASRVKPAKYSYLTGDPTSFKMAMKCPKKAEWEQAVDQELENIEGHDVWDYGNTFAPTGKFTTLLILLLFALDKKLAIR
ncbi:hypothetical protein MJO29_015200 [Puccinia striiformis f. sp. tritici]|nr:hypothetical protein MJO29_015200 [Puccinia striiformis f. sp. tritici]